LDYERIKAANRRMNNLLDNVLLVSKSKSGKVTINSMHLPLTNFCQELIEEMRMSIGSNHVINFVSQGNDDTVIWFFSSG